MVYVKSEVLPIGPWRLFTQKGEVKDKNTFLDPEYRYDTAIFREFSKNITGTLNVDFVRIMGPNEASVRDYPTYRDCSLAVNEIGFVLTRRDTITLGVCGEQMTKHLNYFIGIVKPDIYSEYLYTSTAGGFCFRYTTRKKYVFNGHPVAFYAPYIFFIVRTRTNTGSVLYDGSFTMNNNLVRDFYKHLGEGQTVSLMEYQLSYKSK